MGELGGIILWLVIGLCVLYFLIQWAIDNSKTAKNIQEIRDILVKQYPTSKESTYSEKDNEIKTDNLPGE